MREGTRVYWFKQMEKSTKFIDNEAVMIICNRVFGFLFVWGAIPCNTQGSLLVRFRGLNQISCVQCKLSFHFTITLAPGEQCTDMNERPS